MKKYAIVVYTNGPAEGPFFDELAKGVFNSGVFLSQADFNSKVDVIVRGITQASRDRGITRDPTAYLGFFAPDGSIMAIAKYDQYNISSNRVASQIADINPKLEQQGGGWVIGSQYGTQGGLPVGVLGVLSTEGLEVPQWIKSGLEKALLYGIIALLGYQVIKDKM